MNNNNNTKPSTSSSSQIGTFHRSKTANHTGRYFSPSWLLMITLLQTIATIVLVGLFFIPYDVKLMSSCILSINQMGFGQYDLIQLGLLIAGPIYLCVLCLEALFHRQSACLYAMLLFEFWIIVFTSIQAYQHSLFIQEFLVCHVNDQNNTSTTENSINNNNNNMMLPYGVIGASCIGFLLLLIISIYHRKSFHQSIDSLHGTLTSLLKLDSFLLFTYVIEIMPIPMMMLSSSPSSSSSSSFSITLAEIILLYSFGFLLFLLSWSTVLVTWQSLPSWRIVLHMVSLGILCLICMGYLCYRLIGFALTTNYFLLRIRYSLIFACLAFMITLLLTTSLVMTFAARQWKLRRHSQLQQQQQQHNDQYQIEKGHHHHQHEQEQEQKKEKGFEKRIKHNEQDDNVDELFLTPQVSRIT